MPILIIIFLSFTGTSSHATSFYPQAFPKTVQDAPVVVRGKVQMSYSDWGKDEGGTQRIYTFYELQVSEGLKGSATGQALTGQTLMMREMGGVKDGMGMEVPGASQYQRGEDVVVFLRDKNPDGTFDVQGLMMGKLNIQTDSDGNETLVGAAITPTDPPSPKWTIDALRHLIKEQLQNGSLSLTQNTNKKPVPTSLENPPTKTSQVHTVSAPPLTLPSISAPQLQTSQETDLQGPLKFLGILAVFLITAGLIKSLKKNP